MADHPKVDEAREIVLELGFPPTTLTLRPSQAVGHRLAKPVSVRGPAPGCPFATVDGISLKEDDVLGSSVARASHDDEDNGQGGGYYNGQALTRHQGLGPTDTGATAAAGGGEVVINLRPAPSSTRKEDGIKPGEGCAIASGEMMPRGSDLVYPLSLVAPAPGTGSYNLPPAPPPGSEENSEGEDDGKVPVMEPPKDWDLPPRYATGAVTLGKLDQRPTNTNVSYGAWSRGKEPVIAERTIVRPGELAIMEALGVSEVTVYRRPVVGIACLAPPFPSEASYSDSEGTAVTHPLLAFGTQLARAARVAALPLGMAPRQFRPLTKLVQRWLEQVDILMLVGGSNFGPRCLALDIISSLGEVKLAGMDLTPGENTSVGMVNSKPVFSMPGSLADVLSGFVMLVRPLAHRYLTPHQFSATIDVELEVGSSLHANRDTAVPVRFGYNRDNTGFSTRFSGRIRDPWMDYVRGQALVVLEAGREYHDGEVVQAQTY